ncbi:MAG TPA: diacylglycerol kinase family protein [Kineosporiaceae bacterium]
MIAAFPAPPALLTDLVAAGWGGLAAWDRTPTGHHRAGRRTDPRPDRSHPMSDLAARPAPAEPPATGRTGVALVVNPLRISDVDRLTAGITHRCAEHHLPPPVVLSTSAADPGRGPTRQAVGDGAGLVLAAGGDGTVRAVAEGLVGTGVPLGVLPLGTGNLLARNLGLPMSLREAVRTALTGADRIIDVGRLEDGTVFAIMAGVGLDAAMMRAAPEQLKVALGWLAYAVGGLRSMRRARLEVDLRLDGEPPLRAQARTVLVGNVGRLHAGLELAPDARPDDGVLDVVLVCPRRVADWLILLARALTHRRRSDHRMSRYQARHVEVRLLEPQPRQVDGELLDSAPRLVARVEPRALVVRVPRT